MTTVADILNDAQGMDMPITEQQIENRNKSTSA